MFTLNHELADENLQEYYYKNIKLSKDYNRYCDMAVVVLRKFVSKNIGDKTLLLTRDINPTEECDYYIHIVSTSCQRPENGRTVEALQSFLESRGSMSELYIVDNHYYIYASSAFDVSIIFTAIASWGKVLLGEDLSELKTFCMAYSRNEETQIKNILDEELNTLPDYKRNKHIKILNNFSKDFYQTKLNSFENQIRQARDLIESYNSSIFAEVGKIKRLERERAYLSKNEAEDFTNYVLSVKDIEPIDLVDTNTLRVRVFNTLNNFDTDVYKITKNQSGSYINDFLTKHPKYESLLDKIFISKELTMNQTADFTINITSGCVNCYSLSQNQLAENCVFNIHANSYNCMGEYGSMIGRAMMSCDYIGVLELLKNYVGSLNLSDTTVANTTLAMIYERKDDSIIKVIATGEMVTPNFIVGGNENGETD